MIWNYLFYIQYTLSKKCYGFRVNYSTQSPAPRIFTLIWHFLMSLFLWYMPSCRVEGEFHPYFFLMLHSRLNIGTQSLLFLSCFLSMNYQPRTQPYSLAVTYSIALPRLKHCVISGASWKVHLAHVFIKIIIIIITDFRYLIMKRLIKTGFAFNCPNKVQCVWPGRVHFFVFQIFRRV